MKNPQRRVFLAGILLFFVCSLQTVVAQVQTARYVSMTANTNGFYEYLPQGYSPTGSSTYPLLIFIHGLGETGPGNASTLPSILRNGPPKLINQGAFPASFTVNGQTHRFIVISPQFNGWPTSANIDGVINYCIANYRVNPKRVYITGLSMGGGATWDYASNSSNYLYVQRTAAIAPVCGAASPIIDKANTMANFNLPVWAFHNQGDPTAPVSYTNDFISLTNNRTPAPVPLAKKTIFQVSGHDAWSTAYNPSYRENNMNVYEWMLQYERPNPPASGNIVPTANAGPDKTVNTSSGNSVTVTGTGNDPNGSITAYSWEYRTGPAQYNISNPNSASTVLSNLVAGDYVFRLKVYDNQSGYNFDDVKVTVTSGPPNNPPTANASPDKTITLPVNSVVLQGSGSDPGGYITAYRWRKLNGPAQYSFNDSTMYNPTVNNLVAGVYTFRLSVTDNQGATGYDDVVVTVNGTGGNTPPTANAGTDKALTLPANSVALTGSGADPGGSISLYRWKWIAGPAQFAISDSTVTSPTISNLIAGTYTFRLTVTDNLGATGFDEMKIVVSPAAGNVAPVANAGADKALTLPANSVALTGSGTDGDGTISSYRWRKTAGPAAFTISDSTTANTTISNLAVGSYTFRLTVTDNIGATGYDEMLITVSESVPAGTTKYIKVNLYNNTNPYTNAEWNNWSLTVYGSTNISTAFLKYSDGTTSTVKALLSQHENIGDNGAAYTGGIAPAQVLRHASYSLGTRTLTISGLTPGKTYSFDLYASRATAAVNRTVYAIGALRDTVLASNNHTETGRFTSIAANAQGQIAITISKLDTYNYLNGFIITEEATAGKAGAAEQPLITSIEAGNSSLEVYPNPVTDRFTVRLNNTYKGDMKILITDMSGVVRKQFNFSKSNEGSSQVYLSIDDLPAGEYIIVAQSGDLKESTKLIKM